MRAIATAYGWEVILELRHLRYFLAVVEMGSLSKAAGTLGVTQPSLSQQIGAIEHEFGVPLLLRSSTGVRPTDAGTKLYRHARTVLRQVHELQADLLNEAAGAVGHVAVGLPTSIAAVLAVPLFERLAQHHPGVHLQLFESFSGYLVELLAHGRLDMAILFRDTETPGIKLRPLFAEYLSLYGATEIGDPLGLTCDLAQLGGIKFVLPGRANGLRLLIERVFAQAKVELHVVADIDSLPVMMSLARSGAAATINSIGVARSVEQRVLARRIVNPTIERPVCLCLPTGTPQSAASLATEETIRTLAREYRDVWDRVG